MKKTLLFPFLLTFFALSLRAQEDIEPCATPPGHSEWLEAYQADPQAFPKSDQTLYLPVKVHVVGNDYGFGYFSTKEVFDAFCTLNEDFVDTGIQLYLDGGLNFIDNLAYYDHDYEAGADMMFEHNVPGAINCYIVKNPAGACGYYWGWPDAVALRKDCIGPGDHTWAHEIGHFLTLPHTFSGWEGTSYTYEGPAPSFVGGRAVEKVNGSNCANAGDGFCDTPPDYLSFRWNCSDNSLSPGTLFDPDSVAFQSDGTLFMSYAYDQCSSRFSIEQTDAMRANAQFGRPDLPVDATPLGPIAADALSNVSPADGEMIESPEAAFFSWNPIENASHYVVQFSLTEEFVFILHEYFVSEPQLITGELRSNRTYYWRVIPYNPFYTCQDFLPQHTFETGDLTTATAEVPGLNDLLLSPNPAASGQEVLLQFSLQQDLPLRLRLFHPTGALLREQAAELQAGDNQLSIRTEDLAPGVYLLNLENNRRKTVRKIIIH